MTSTKTQKIIEEIENRFKINPSYKLKNFLLCLMFGVFTIPFLLSDKLIEIIIAILLIILLILIYKTLNLKCEAYFGD